MRHRERERERERKEEGNKTHRESREDNHGKHYVRSTNKDFGIVQ
jgi:hypothetical protein